MILRIKCFPKKGRYQWLIQKRMGFFWVALKNFEYKGISFYVNNWYQTEGEAIKVMDKIFKGMEDIKTIESHSKVGSSITSAADIKEKYPEYFV